MTIGEAGAARFPSFVAVSAGAKRTSSRYLERYAGKLLLRSRRSALRIELEGNLVKDTLDFEHQQAAAIADKKLSRIARRLTPVEILPAGDVLAEVLLELRRDTVQLVLR